MTSLAEMERLAQVAIVNKWKLKMCLKEARLMVRFTNTLKEENNEKTITYR